MRKFLIFLTSIAVVILRSWKTCKCINTTQLSLKITYRVFLKILTLLHFCSLLRVFLSFQAKLDTSRCSRCQSWTASGCCAEKIPDFLTGAFGGVQNAAMDRANGGRRRKRPFDRLTEIPGGDGNCELASQYWRIGVACAIEHKKSWDSFMDWCASRTERKMLSSLILSCHLYDSQSFVLNFSNNKDRNIDGQYLDL